MSQAEFHSVEPFGVDGNELDGLPANKIFTLGVEWGLTFNQLDSGESFARPIHIENRDRLEAMLNRHGREFTINFMADDVSESWLWLDVKARNSN